MDATHVYDIMWNMKNQLTTRKNDHFFGFHVNKALKNLLPPECKRFEKEALNVYTKAIDYLNKWFDFDNSIYKDLRTFKLKNELPVFQEVIDTSEKLDIKVNQFNTILLYKKSQPHRKGLEEGHDFSRLHTTFTVA